ncbi:MAG: hypothetical protein VXZ00_08300, partial [Pseudomonadota bacterium]|nr:hypothetical protein [Pseudomonadota bacterium]
MKSRNRPPLTLTNEDAVLPEETPDVALPATERFDGEPGHVADEPGGEGPPQAELAPLPPPPPERPISERRRRRLAEEARRAQEEAERLSAE